MYIEMRLESSHGEIVHKIDSLVVPRENEYVIIDDKAYRVSYVVYITTEYGSMCAVIILKDDKDKPKKYVN